MHERLCCVRAEPQAGRSSLGDGASHRLQDGAQPISRRGGDETLVRLMRYLGATDEQIADYEDQRRRWGQGSIHVNLLGANRKTCSGSTGQNSKNESRASRVSRIALALMRWKSQEPSEHPPASCRESASARARRPDQPRNQPFY
jgi:hypothetical protein